MTKLCPCGRPLPLEACCGRYLRGWEQPETAEALMRARYTAYALAEVDYLLETHDPDHTPDRGEVLDWARRARFTSLVIEEVVAGAPDDDTGVVQFAASFEENGVLQQHRERSRFGKRDGRWYYLDGAPPTARRTRVGRNDPCPCGSGKKYKKCCG